MVASPVPQMAFTRRRTYCAGIGDLSILIGAATGPVRGTGWPFAAGGFGVLSGAGFPGFAGGAGVGSLTYFNGKSEMMPCFSDTFAFN